MSLKLKYIFIVCFVTAFLNILIFYTLYKRNESFLHDKIRNKIRNIVLPPQLCWNDGNSNRLSNDIFSSAWFSWHFVIFVFRLRACQSTQSVEKNEVRQAVDNAAGKIEKDFSSPRLISSPSNRRTVQLGIECQNEYRMSGGYVYSRICDRYFL